MKEKIFFQVNVNYAIFFLIATLIMPSHFVLAANMEEFYPLQQENTWIYAKIEDNVNNEEILKIKGEEEIGGVRTVRLFNGENDYDCLAFDSQGIKKYKEKDEDQYLIPQSPIIIIPNIEVGEEVTYSRNFISNSLDNQKINEFKADVHIKLLSIEDVIIPAGKFSDCLKFSYINYKSTDSGHEEEKIVFWLVRGVGKVKEVSINIDNDRNKEVEISTETHILISAIINGKKIGGQ